MRASWGHSGLAVLLALAAACASPPPKPTAHAPALAAAPGAAPVYFSPGQIDATALIEPPPVAGSEAERADLQAVLDAQRAAHEQGTTARAVADTVIDCQRVADVLEPSAAVAGGEGAVAVAFATRAAKQVSAATNAPKTHWERPRPYVISTAVERLGDVAPDSPFAIKGGYERAHTSYPSGHTAFGTGCAIVLAQMVPEQAGALFERARLYGESRLIVGAHFRTDVDAGRRIGTAAAAVMLQDAQFQADLHAARAQLRKALGLPQVQ
ncbi:MAG TPA: phosphatase PAP2 family protein [Steroidobacteraceae bacterium]|nr:phosphatase PAP2 family protein [Steroidobacteraceae bacterium]